MRQHIIPTIDSTKIYLALLIAVSIFILAVLPPSRMYDIPNNIQNQLIQDSILIETTYNNQLHYLSTLADSQLDLRNQRILFDDSITKEAKTRIKYYQR